MKIAAIEAIPYSIPYLHPLHFASGSVHEADHVLVRLRTDDGVVGTADAPPRPYTYGETQKSIVAVVQDVFAPQLIGVDIFDREKIQEILYRTIHNQTAKGAVDIALWDVIGKTLGQPVTKLLGGYTDSLRVSHMLGFKPAQELLELALSSVHLRHQHVQAQDRPPPAAPGHRGRPGPARGPWRGRRAVHGCQPGLVRQ
jgi:L-alanine-DL-glutamate epimerase-like enolase superfamily enzyme